MRNISVEKKDGKYNINTNVVPSTFESPSWITTANYADQAIPPAGTKVRCYKYWDSGEGYYEDIVADGSQNLDSYFGWDLYYIGNIGDVFMINKYQGNH